MKCFHLSQFEWNPKTRVLDIPVTDLFALGTKMPTHFQIKGETRTVTFSFHHNSGRMHVYYSKDEDIQVNLTF